MLAILVPLGEAPNADLELKKKVSNLKLRTELSTCYDEHTANTKTRK